MDETAAERCARQERLLEERRRVLGEEHPDTLTAMLDLADCLWAQGRLLAARKLEEQVVAGRRRLLGEDHFDTLKATGKLAVTMAAQGELAAARELQERVVNGMRSLYGDCGLETLRSINNLAGTVSAQGDFETARELLELVLATTCREFGEEHADSLTAMANLAAVLWQQGDQDEAYALQQHVVEVHRGIRSDDEVTRAAAEVLAARMLNDRQTPPPQKRSDRPHATWCPTAVRAMLRNEVYVGTRIWNRTKFVKTPGTNKRVARPRPRREWQTRNAPELRIINDDL